MTDQLCVMCFDPRGNGGGGIAPTITGDHQNRITDYTAIVVISEKTGQNFQEDDKKTY